MVNITEEDTPYIEESDDERRSAHYDWVRGIRRTPLTNNILVMLGQLIPPETDAFPHINRDMASSNVDIFDKFRVQNLSTLVNFCNVFELRKSSLFAFNDMVTILTVNKSKEGWWGNLFTTTVTKKAEEFQDKTQKKTSWLSLARRKEVE